MPPGVAVAGVGLEDGSFGLVSGILLYVGSGDCCISLWRGCISLFLRARSRITLFLWFVNSVDPVWVDMMQVLIFIL